MVAGPDPYGVFGTKDRGRVVAQTHGCRPGVPERGCSVSSWSAGEHLHRPRRRSLKPERAHADDLRVARRDRSGRPGDRSGRVRSGAFCLVPCILQVVPCSCRRVTA